MVCRGEPNDWWDGHVLVVIAEELGDLGGIWGIGGIGGVGDWVSGEGGIGGLVVVVLRVRDNWMSCLVFLMSRCLRKCL